jgi:O-antigen ligase
VLAGAAVAVALPAALLAVVIVGLVVVLAFPSALRLDLDDAESLDDATSGRYELVRGGIDLARDRPLTGWGSGAFARAYLDEGFGARSDAVSASHTIPLTVTAEQGIAGLALYVALLAAALHRLLAGARGDPHRAVVAAGLVAVVVHTWLYAAFLEDPVTWTLLAVGTSLAARRRASGRRDSRAAVPAASA